MQYTPRFTYLATRLRDGALIIIPNRRHRKGTTKAQRKAIARVTANANARAADANLARDKANEEQDIIELNRNRKEAL